MPMTGLSADVLTRTLETSGIPVTSAQDFLERPDECASYEVTASTVRFLSSREDGEESEAIGAGLADSDIPF